MRDQKHIVFLKDCAIYQGKNLILSKVNLTISRGDFSYLIGKTGTGKSTLMKLLYGELPLAAGTAFIAGYSLKNLHPKRIPFLRRKLGIVFQDFQLLTDRNVMQNLIFTLRAIGWTDKKEMLLRAKDCLNLVGIKNKESRMPHELSGGEQQRVVIARALLNYPELILADEPTGNLDPETSDEIMALLLAISKKLGTAVILATHDYYTLEKFPGRIIKCVNGTILDEEQLVVRF